jgi:ABC-type nitrate/sulfonate/bicarbonate transport system substrate-binding protein
MQLTRPTPGSPVRCARHPLTVALSVALALTLSACGSDEAEPAAAAAAPSDAGGVTCADLQDAGSTQQVRLAQISEGAPTWNSYVADAAGIYDTYGLAVERVNLAPPTLASALIKGDAHFTANIGSTVRAALEGNPVSVVAVTTDRPTFAIIADESVTSIEDLRGKRIVTSNPTSSPAVVLAEYLAEHDLDAKKDITIINVADEPTRSALLQTGRADAAILNLDVALRLTKDNPKLRVIVAPDELVRAPNTGMAVSDDLLQKDPELVQRLLCAARDATAFLLENPKETQQAFQDALKFGEQEAVSLYDYLKPTVLEDLTPTDEMLAKEAELDGKALGRAVTVEELTSHFDLSMLEQLQR